MQAKMLLEYFSIAQVILCVSMLILLWRRKLLGEFPWLAAFMAVRVADEFINIPLLFFRRELGIPKLLAYKVYFYSSWADFVLEALLSVLIIYAIYKMAMKPLEGLNRIGTIIFRWVMIASAVVALGIVIVPRMDASALHALEQRVQQGINVLTLCLLLFVCFAIRPLGLTYRSRVFGVSLGLGIMATVSLVEAAWYSTTAAQSVYSPLCVVGAVSSLTALLVWGGYFALPEPKNKMVLLPTTSPFFFWNRISEALSEPAGFVAVSGFSPEMLEPAELKVLTAASKIARERQRRDDADPGQAGTGTAQSFPIAMRR